MVKYISDSGAKCITGALGLALSVISFHGATKYVSRVGNLVEEYMQKNIDASAYDSVINALEFSDIAPAGGLALLATSGIILLGHSLSKN